MNAELSAGALIASVLLMARAVAPMDRAITSWRSILNTRTALRRINNRLGEAPTLKPVTPMPAPEGNLNVESLYFKHARSPSTTVRGVSFEVHPGEVVALVGPSAAGKSTLAKLLVGAVKPYKGHVRWGNTDIHRWDKNQLGRYIGYLPQNVELFSGTIRENIARLNQENLDLVIEAAKFTGIDDIIQRQPKGYETQIGDNGAYLSGGQRQLIGLARAVYASPGLVVLDEPDASLDKEGKECLAKTLENLKARGTMVVYITQQISSEFANIDKYLAMSEGRVKLSSVTDKKLYPKKNETSSKDSRNWKNKEHTHG